MRCLRARQCAGALALLRVRGHRSHRGCRRGLAGGAGWSHRATARALPRAGDWSGTRARTCCLHTEFLRVCADIAGAGARSCLCGWQASALSTHRPQKQQEHSSQVRSIARACGCAAVLFPRADSGHRAQLRSAAAARAGAPLQIRAKRRGGAGHASVVGEARAFFAGEEEAPVLRIHSVRPVVKCYFA